MVATQERLEVAPHYAAMLLLSLLAVVFLHPFVVRRMEYEPDAW
jgi:hypothetical protein